MTRQFPVQYHIQSPSGPLLLQPVSQVRASAFSGRNRLQNAVSHSRVGPDASNHVAVLSQIQDNNQYGNSQIHFSYDSSSIYSSTGQRILVPKSSLRIKREKDARRKGTPERSGLIVAFSDKHHKSNAGYAVNNYINQSRQSKANNLPKKSFLVRTDNNNKHDNGSNPRALPSDRLLWKRHGSRASEVKLHWSAYRQKLVTKDFSPDYYLTGIIPAGKSQLEYEER